jgi:hypothetical protein
MTAKRKAKPKAEPKPRITAQQREKIRALYDDFEEACANMEVAEMLATDAADALKKYGLDAQDRPSWVDEA